MRNNDCLIIAQQLLNDYSIEEGKKFKGFDSKAIEIITNYSWPGNVRMLQNVIRQIVVLNNSGLVTSAMLPIEMLQENIVDDEKKNPHLLAFDDCLNLLPSRKNLPTLISHDSDNFKPENVRLITEVEDDIIPLWQSEKQIIENAIAHCNGNVPKAAALLDISASTIYRKRQSWAQFSSINAN